MADHTCNSIQDEIKALAEAIQKYIRTCLPGGDSQNSSLLPDKLWKFFKGAYVPRVPNLDEALKYLEAARIKQNDEIQARNSLTQGWAAFARARHQYEDSNLCKFSNYFLLGYLMFFVLAFLFLGKCLIEPIPCKTLQAILKDHLFVYYIFCFGGLGATVYSLITFCYHLGKRDFESHYYYWYLVRPWLGGIFALALYFMLISGVYSLSGTLITPDTLKTPAVSTSTQPSPDQITAGNTEGQPGQSSEKKGPEKKGPGENNSRKQSDKYLLLFLAFMSGLCVRYIYNFMNKILHVLLPYDDDGKVSGDAQMADDPAQTAKLPTPAPPAS